jgi:sarcosine oxidase
MWDSNVQDRNAAHDVIVIGLGGMGSCAAAALARRGLRVAGFERFHALHDRGSSHGRSRIIRQAYFEHPSYVPLLRRAYELWVDLASASGRRLYLKTGGLMVGREDSPLVCGTLQSARVHGLPHEILDATALRRRFPATRPFPDEVGVFEEPAGVLFPEACIEAALAVAAAHGAQLTFSAPVTGWSADDHAVQVRLASGSVLEAAHLVICAGAWAGRLLADLGLPLRVERNVMHWFAPLSGADRALLEPARLPVYILDRPGRPMLYGFPLLDDTGVKAAFHHSGLYADPETLERRVDETEVNAVRDALRAWLPDAAGDCLASSACMYTLTPDEHFVIGRHPHHDRVVVACGFSGHGFKFCSVVGEIVADLVIDTVTRHDISLFDVRRFGSG